MRTSTRPRTLRLEPLEDRRAPAVDVFQRDNTLFLIGDAADDWVAVCDEGRQVVEVQTTRGTETFLDVCWIVGNLGEGSDTFEFHQAEGQPSELLDVRLDLAAGDDRFLYRTPPPVPGQPPPNPDVPATYSFDVRMGLGNDVMNMGPGVVPGLDLFVRADLGDGHDTFDTSHQRGPAARVGVIQPCISLAVEAGAGDDLVNVAIGNPDELDPLRLEDVDISIGLGGGDDVGIFIICNVAVPGVLSQAVNGGEGGDTVGFIIDGCRVGTLVQQANGGDGGDSVGFIIDGGRVGSLSQTMSLGGGDDAGIIIIGGNVAVPGLTVMRMDGGPGADFASVMIQDSEDFNAFGGPVTLRVALGGDGDLANVVIRDANDFAGPLTVAADGGAGDDGIVADIDFTPRVRATQLDPGNAPVSVLADLRGGDGHDSIDAYTEGTWGGIARFNLRGDGGDDFVGFHGVIGDGSTGTLAVDQDGGAGADVMAAALFLTPEPHLAPIAMRMLGGTGDDRMFLGLLGGPDTRPGLPPPLLLLDGGAGDDQLAAVQAVRAGSISFDFHLVGGIGDDHLVGSVGDDILEGGAGHDTLDGQGGSDVLFGGYGNDILLGGEGDDELYGGDGADLLNGEEGDDLLHAGSGFGLFIDDADPDVLIGGSGADRFTFVFPGDVIVDFNPAEGDHLWF